MTTRTVSAAGNHVRQPLTSREVQNRSLVDMHYQQQLNGNFPPFLAQPFGLQYRDWKQKFLPPVYCEGLLCRGARHTGSFSLCDMAHSPHARRVCRGKKMVRKERMLDDRNNKCRSSAARDGNFQKHPGGGGQDASRRQVF